MNNGKPADGKPKKELTPRRRKRRRILRIILITLVAALIIFRLLLPRIVLNYVNKTLSEMEEYYGHVEDIDLHLYRGAYVIKNIKILKLESKDKNTTDTLPFFKSDAIDLSVEWKSLFKGRIVSELEFTKPVINYVKGSNPDKEVKQDTADFRKLVKDLVPIKINRFQIVNGEIHYIDPGAQPKIDVFMNNIQVLATNLSNVTEKGELLTARMRGTGDVYDGRFVLNTRMNLLEKDPTFDLNAELITLNLVNLNPMMQAYGNFDVKKGNFSLYTEFAAKRGEFGGYVKPIIKDLDVVQWNKEEGNFKQILWETLVGSAAEVFQNQNKEQLATKVDINGKFTDPNINTWRAISYVLRNAFAKALQPAIDETINIGNINEEPGKKTFLEKVFGDKDKDKDKKDDKNKK